MSKPFCVVLSQLSSQKYLWAGSLSGYSSVIELSLCLAELFLVFVSAGYLFPTIFQQEPCIMSWWWKMFLTACLLTYLTTFPHSLAVFSLCLAEISHLPPVALSYCSFLFWRFFSCFVSSPLAIPTPPHSFVIVCQMQDIQWGWSTCVFAAAVRIQKGDFGYRSCCFLVTLSAWVTTSSNRSAPRAKGEWERDFEACSSLSVVWGLCPQWVG